MNSEQEFEKKLTWEEIEAEIGRVGDFFKRIPDELKSHTADCFIYEIVNWGSYNHYEALGIFEEAKNRYRERSLEVLAEEVEEERLEAAFESAVDYRCVKEIDLGEDRGVTVGEICRIGFVEDNDGYSGGKRYEVFRGNGNHFDICQHVLDAHFELVDGEEKELN